MCDGCYFSLSNGHGADNTVVETGDNSESVTGKRLHGIEGLLDEEMPSRYAAWPRTTTESNSVDPIKACKEGDSASLCMG